MTRVLGVLGLLVALYAALIASDPSAGKLDNLIDVANIQGRYGVITLGAALVIITGGIDLSDGAILGFTGMVSGVVMQSMLGLVDRDTALASSAVTKGGACILSPPEPMSIPILERRQSVVAGKRTGRVDGDKRGLWSVAHRCAGAGVAKIDLVA